MNHPNCSAAEACVPSAGVARYMLDDDDTYLGTVVVDQNPPLPSVVDCLATGTDGNGYGPGSFPRK